MEPQLSTKTPSPTSSFSFWEFYHWCALVSSSPPSPHYASSLPPTFSSLSFACDGQVSVVGTDLTMLIPPCHAPPHIHTHMRCLFLFFRPLSPPTTTPDLSPRVLFYLSLSTMLHSCISRPLSPFWSPDLCTL
eukprot:RCo050310